MRLIDADTWMESIDPVELAFSNVDVVNTLNHVPTAYDMDKVMEQLSLERSKAIIRLGENKSTYKDFCKYMKDNLTLIQRSDISDMFEPIMPKSCDYPFGVGHGSSYWINKDNGKEGFAEMYSAMVNNSESLEQIKKFFPESFKIFQEMLEVVK